MINKSVDRLREIALGMHALHRRMVEHYSNNLPADFLRSHADLITGMAREINELEKSGKEDEKP